MNKPSCLSFCFREMIHGDPVFHESTLLADGIAKIVGEYKGRNEIV